MRYVTWQALDTTHHIREGACFIEDPVQISSWLQAQGLELISVHEPARWRLSFQSARCWRASIEQVAVLIRSYVPLYEALMIAADGVRDPYVKLLLREMAGEVSNGGDVARVCDAQADIIGALYGHICRVGMQTGALASLLQEYVALQDRLAAHAQRMRAQLIGPAVILLLMIALVIIGLYALVPLMQQLYSTLSSPEPPILALLAYIRQGCMTYVVWLVGAFCGMIILYLWWRRHYPMSHDWVCYYMPVYGRIRRGWVMNRWSMTLSGFLAQKLTLSQALSMTELMADGPVMRGILADIGQEIRKGKQLSDVVSAYPDFFPPALVSVIRIGLSAYHLDHTLQVWSRAGLIRLEEDIQRIQWVALLIVYSLIALCALMGIWVLYEPLWHMPDVMQGV